jgi:hypothetical protein
MKHESLIHPATTTLRERHRELLADIEVVAERANAARRATGPGARQVAADISDAAEAALVRVGEAWRGSRGRAASKAFFQPLSRRLQRIIAHYRVVSVDKDQAAEKSESGRWLYRIVNYEQIPFDRLKPWFRASAVDEAIRTGITLGLRELPGVRIFQENPDE